MLPNDIAQSRKKEMNWVDCASLIVGIMLGTGIFVVFPKLVAEHHPSLFMILLAWALGTLVAIAGALCYAELASIYPENGGDYVFLRETYQHNNKNAISFLFAWAQILVIRPASLISLAIVLGMNFNIVLNRFTEYYFFYSLTQQQSQRLLTLVAISTLILFTYVSVTGLKSSKWVQNILTVIKIICILIIIGFGLYLGRHMSANLKPLLFPSDMSFFDLFKHLGMALVPIMWVFGGWNEAPYVAGEVKDPTRQLPKALLRGLIILGLLYIVVNFVYVLHLTPQGLAGSWNFATDLMKSWFGTKGEVFLAVVLVLSAAGAINGLTMTGGRMTQALSADYPLFRPLAIMHPKYNTPVAALVFNFVITLIMAIIVQCSPNSIDKLLVFTAGVIWIFFALVVVAVFMTRKKLKPEQIPYKIPLYPLTPLVFLLMCGYMIWGAWEYKPAETLWGIAILIVGVPVYYGSVKFIHNSHR